ncbi:MAG: hypothetical protein Q7S20_13625 [Gemmatimonadaceae bacterium]|nr:hypothetical protein [Gemmatimonadaceae bacterium]
MVCRERRDHRGGRHPAVWLGAFDLAVGNLFGSNSFNMIIFLAPRFDRWEFGSVLMVLSYFGGLLLLYRHTGARS